MQGDRKMTASNFSLHGMTNNSSSAVLSAVVEAVEWKHAAEIPGEDGKRPGKRVVIHPPELNRLQTVLPTEESQRDVADGQDIACERIAAAKESFEHPPKLFPSDHENFEGYAKPPEVAQWMNMSS
jgi:hypothetical protein